ncbi:hypothetical protein MRB53_013836 [Persea americana]|uniref:Uncharacterized protein n=1 Tax=Persea americana TaxID=3435 RepID=A0ACC2K929_PERAE|nr:hypothetical protein MRB53_013836 [Persea americana]
MCPPLFIFPLSSLSDAFSFPFIPKLQISQLSLSPLTKLFFSTARDLLLLRSFPSLPGHADMQRLRWTSPPLSQLILFRSLSAQLAQRRTGRRCATLPLLQICATSLSVEISKVSGDRLPTGLIWIKESQLHLDSRDSEGIGKI